MKVTMRNTKSITKCLALLGTVALSATLGISAATSDISVNLKLDAVDYVTGERVRAVIEIHNITPDTLSVGYPDSKDKLFVEIFKASNMEQLSDIGRRPYTAKFRLGANRRKRFETHLGDHYALDTPRRYLARPVLIHDGNRYVGDYRAFDIVPGMAITEAMQTFANSPGLTREFELVHWARGGTEHLFLKSHDEGPAPRKWETFDLGALVKVKKPVIAIQPSGKVFILHRFDPDSFIQSEFWSMPTMLHFKDRQLVEDPETAGQSRIQEMYEGAGGVKPIARPWWKFW